MAPDPSVRVLVVDDCPLKRDGVIAALDADPDIEVVGHAETHHAALAMVAELEPTVVIIEPAVMSARGRSTLRRFVAALLNTPVVAVGAGDRGDDVVDAVGAGVSGYLGRRTSAADLRDTVKKVHGGAAVIDPALAGQLMGRYAALARGGQEQTSETPLDARELAVLRLMSQGHTQDEIGEKLQISPRTVQVVSARIRHKTGLRRRVDLVRWAAEHVPA